MTVQYESLTPDAPPIERRQSQRFRFSFMMPAYLGRGDAVILDIGAQGARVMHFAPHALDSQVRLVFFYAGKRFAANARVLAGRVIGLGNGPGGTTTYQSRLQFIDAPEDAAETLIHIIEHIENERMRGWMSNASGDERPNENRDHHFNDAQYFMRCRLRGRSHWDKCWTRDATQPSDGFAVPAKLSDGEVNILCEAYEKMDDEGRDLIRATACHAE
jgi:hypothetical protein